MEKIIEPHSFTILMVEELNWMKAPSVEVPEEPCDAEDTKQFYHLDDLQEGNGRRLASTPLQCC